MGATRRLIPYAGYERPKALTLRRIPVERAIQLRSEGMPWKTVAWELSQEYDTKMPFTADGVQMAVSRLKKKEMQSA